MDEEEAKEELAELIDQKETLEVSYLLRTLYGPYTVRKIDSVF